MSFPGGTGSSRQLRYGGYNTRTGTWVGPSPSQEPGAVSEREAESEAWKSRRKKRLRKEELCELASLAADTPSYMVHDKLTEMGREAEAKEYLTL